MGPGEAEGVHQGDDVAAKVGKRIGAGRDVRAAVAARVETHDEEFLRQRGRDLVKDGEIRAERMAEDHRGGFARGLRLRH